MAVPTLGSVKNDWLRTSGDGVARCWWPGDDPGYIRYHDIEWGRPVTDDRALYEKLCLEGFQAGLSWLTILRKRENFRAAFRDFDPEVVAGFTDSDVERLMQDPGIVRHRGKIEATISNARSVIALVEGEGSLGGFIWAFAPRRPHGRDGEASHPSGTPTTSPSAVALSKELKRRGFKFVGPTTVYSFMQSMGLINDHLDGCHVRAECEVARCRVVSEHDQKSDRQPH